MPGDEAYTAAAVAVQAGTADAVQKALNDKMAKQMGNMGNQARDARGGK